MTSLERVLTTLGHKEPDRVPLVQMFSLYGAKELGISIKEYFSNPQNIVAAQLRMQEKYSNDCVLAFSYASLEMEAFGGDTIFIEDGPPNAGAPVINSIEDINKLTAPKIENTDALQNTLETIRLLKKEVGDKIPIMGAVISPFSLPVMQMGFDKYLDLIIENRPQFEKLMAINEEFCVNWANAQLEAGATALGYADPVSSPSIITKEMYKQTGWKVAKRTISRINGATATNFASGRALPIIDDIVETGTAVLAPSSVEDIGEVKRKANSRLAIIGNLNAIEMCRWTEKEAEEAVKNIILKAGKGGGLLISDNHGEIPYQVSQKILLAIANAVKKWGTYPLN